MASYQPPPAYREARLAEPSQLEDDIKSRKVKQKPIAFVPPRTSSRTDEVDSKDVTPVLPLRPGLSLDTSISSSSNDTDLYFSPARTDTSISATSTGTAGSISSQTSASSQMRKAYEEARHFAGGLFQRPCESTKHFTILRHSHGLVFYQGSSTSLAISVFSDEPLPPDRTLWLQSKGWAGKTGMRAKAFMGVNGNWLNVTPTLAVGTEQLNPTDERAWQRDFKKFQKKAPSKIRDRHLLRETVIVCIPVEAGDGYFQLVLCQGDNKKKILCTSPAFRVLSTSTNPSSIRGASLSTLPFELGALALASYGKSTVGTAVSTVASPFQSQVQQYMPSFWTRKAAVVAYGVSGVQKKLDATVGDAEDLSERSLEESLVIAEKEELALEEGPKSPYPLNFEARSAATTNRVDQFNLPIVNLLVPDHISMKLHGYYFAWVRPLSKKEKGKPAETSWLQAILAATLIDVYQLARVKVSSASEKQFTLSVIQESDVDDESFNLSEIFEVRVMGFIRPDEPAQQAKLEHGLQAGDEAAGEASMLAEVNDVSMAQGFLDHPSWGPDEIGKGSGEKTTRMEKLKKGYAETRLAAQRHIDKVPLTKIGVRVPGDSIRQKTVVTNGYYVIR